MHWDRDVVAECVVIEHIDAEEQNNVDEPATDRNLVRLEKEWRTLRIELRRQPDDGDEEELDECQEGSCLRRTRISPLMLLPGFPPLPGAAIA